MAAANRNGDVFPDGLRLGAGTTPNENATYSGVAGARQIMQMMDQGVLSEASALARLGLPTGLTLAPEPSRDSADAAAATTAQLQLEIDRGALASAQRQQAATQPPVQPPVQSIGTPISGAADSFDAMQAAVASHFAATPPTVFERHVQQEPMTRTQWEGVATGRRQARESQQPILLQGRRPGDTHRELRPLSEFPQDMQDALRELRQYLASTDAGEELLCDMRNFRKALRDGGWEFAFQRFPEFRHALGNMDNLKAQSLSMPEPPAVVDEPAEPTAATPQTLEKRKRGFDG
jgi:hypothetical protein